MASEEERAKILAEYKAAAAADDDDNEEVDFNPANYDSENDDEFTGDEESSDEEEAIVDPVVLNGTLYINDEGRIIISGTWCLQSQLVTESQDLMCTKPVIKHPKFKLKSQDRVYGTSGPSSLSQSSNEEKKSRRSVLFDIHRPTLSKLPSTDSNDNSIPTRRTMCFDGFFLQPPSPSEDDTPVKQQDKKIKERDVELCFTTGNDTSTYNVLGRGYNEYGQFVLSNGIYTPPPTDAISGTRAKIKVMKTYGSSEESTKETRSGAVKHSRRHNNDDSFDDDFDEKADYGEVNELCEDAGLSIEELRAKYYGGGGGGDDGDDGGGKVKSASPQMKRARLEEDDDDECGF